jgi:tetratricopeptide (TPR) repeat protein
VADSGTPQWWSLEAPPGWGKTRCVQELFARLAAEWQEQPAYWPPALVQPAAGGVQGGADATRKQVAPDPAAANKNATPVFFWWGISCLSRPGSTFEALVNDLDQFRRHEAGLERRWKQLVTPGERFRRHVKKHRTEYTEAGVGEVVPAAAGAAVPGLGLLVLLGKWGVQRGQQEWRERRAVDDVPQSAGASAVDELAPTLERLGAAGLPLVVVVEDVHAADPTLVELLARLLAAQQSRVLLITTAWTGLLTKAGGSAAQLLARVPVERTWRVYGETDLSVEERAELARTALPELDDTSARLLAVRYANPWALQTACSVVRMEASLGPLAAATVDALPYDIAELYRELWKQLPIGVQEVLMLSVLSAPTSVGERLNFGEDRWDPSVVLAAAEAEPWLREQAGPLIEGLSLARDAYSWVRTVEEWLQRFHDPAQRDVALDKARVRYSQVLRRAFYGALVQRLSTAETLAAVQRRQGDRLVLALAAEGFLEPAADAVVTAATRICQVLAASPAVSDHRLLLTTARLVLDAASDAAERRFWDLRDLQGSALARVGRYLDAVGLYRELLADRTRVLGPDAPDTLTTRNNLASLLGRSGQVEAAVAQFGELLADRTRVLGPDAPATLATRNNLAFRLAEAGQVEAAVAQFRELLADRTRVLGPDAPATHKTHRDLATLTGEQEA